MYLNSALHDGVAKNTALLDESIFPSRIGYVQERNSVF